MGGGKAETLGDGYHLLSFYFKLKLGIHELGQPSKLFISKA